MIRFLVLLASITALSDIICTMCIHADYRQMVMTIECHKA